MLSNILNTRYPIIQGAMAHIARGEFVAAISNAGAAGIIASGGMAAERLQEEINICKQKTDKPFGVNLMLLQSNIEELINIIIKEKIPFVTTGSGNPGKMIDRLKEAGVKVFPVIGSPTLVKRLEKYEVDGYICEGLEAGGHIGPMTTMTLLRQVRPLTKKPLIIAGGIADGYQLFAAEVLGADSVQIGSLFLSAKECPIHKNYKDKILKAKDTSVTTIGNYRGLPMRLLKNEMTREYERLEFERTDPMKLEELTFGALRRAVFDGDTKTGSMMCGLTVGQISEEKSIDDILSDLWKEYKAVRKTYEK